MSAMSAKDVDELIRAHERDAMLYCAMNGVVAPPLKDLLTIEALKQLRRYVEQKKEPAT